MIFDVSVWKDMEAGYERLEIRLRDMDGHTPTITLDMYSTKLLRDALHEVIVKHAERYFEFPQTKDRKAELELFMALPDMTKKKEQADK